MNTGAVCSPMDPALKPTWRMLWHSLRTFHSQDANRRAEKLVLRYMARSWSATRLERLLARLIARQSTSRSERLRNLVDHAINEKLPLERYLALSKEAVTAPSHSTHPVRSAENALQAGEVIR